MAGRLSQQRHEHGSHPVRSSSLRLSNPNIFSDDFALEPLNASGNSSPVSQECTSDDVQASAPTTNSTSRPSIRASRSQNDSSMYAKSGEKNAPMPSFADPGAASSSSSPPHRVRSTASSNATYEPHRSWSTSSRFSLPRPLSPYTGAAGPSQPYGMYPQVTRNASVTTSSTVRPAERAFVGDPGPEHPYSMYPQNTVPEEEGPILGASGIPVGFPGMGQQYQRRPGQTSDDNADIIGPDGHTEQLPPYTRYPDDMLPKAAAEQTVVLDTNPSQTPPGDALMPHQSRLSSRTLFSDSGVELNTAAARTAGSDPSGSFKERWKDKSKKRVCCGIPLWVFGLVLFLLLGVVIGGVIGGVVGRKKGAASSSAAADSAAPSTVATATVTSWLDTTSVPTPPDLPPLPTGQFNIPTNSLKVDSNNCIVNQSYSTAWGCMGPQGIGMTTSVQTGGVAQVQFEPQPLNSSFIYGPQPPDLGTQPFILSMSADKDAMNLGPSLFFFDMYDKLVIVPEDAITASPAKRSVPESELFPRNYGMHPQRAQVGDRPWFCFWNQTVIEFFIYVTQNTTAFQNGWDSSSTSVVVVTQSTGVAATAAAAAPSSAFPSSSTYLSPSTTPPPFPQRRETGQSDGFVDFPRFVKLEEKRALKNNPQPYCQQMQILDDLSIVPAGTPNIAIEENDDAPAAATSAAAATSPAAHRRGLGPYEYHELIPRQLTSNTCCCEWLST